MTGLIREHSLAGLAALGAERKTASLTDFLKTNIKTGGVLILAAAVIFFAMPFTAGAQENDADAAEEIEDIDDGGGGAVNGDENAGLPIISDWDGAPLSGYTRGDQTFNISAGILVPLFFLSNSDGVLDNKLSFIGGVGSLAYTYFLNSNLFLGGVLAGSFSQTLGKNFLYMIPVAFTFGYQIVMNRFEFPFSLTVGGVTEQYLTYNGYWLFIKPQASGFFRLNSDWSLGLNAAWWISPQWTNTPEKNALGNFLEITFSARYHF
ncbi:MAG: hypothetical protein LBJ35_05610 [Spirochaetaceae bacterium]|jgi:hypothetical protein|nr:hypothetical protein [Spirochaetaceae bacterium]